MLAYLPYVPVELPGILPGRVNGPGSMQLLAICLTMAGIALSYDVLFGRTGLLSFGHALFVAAGSYLLAISLSSTGRCRCRWRLLAALAATTLLALVVGAIALRVGGIAFAMVTLAFAQAASIIVMRNPGDSPGERRDRASHRDARAGEPARAWPTRPYRYWTGARPSSRWPGSPSPGWPGRGPDTPWPRCARTRPRAAVLGFGTYRAKLARRGRPPRSSAAWAASSTRSCSAARTRT